MHGVSTVSVKNTTSDREVSVNGSGNASTLMLRTFGSELTGLVNSDPAWKVSKGRRSASRRARKSCKSLNNCAGLSSRSSEGSKMPVSESEKRGVSVLGCRFSEKAEHVPIKKRRFLLRTPSPPPRSQTPSPPRPVVSSPPKDEVADLIKGQDASNKLVAAESASCDINPSHVVENNITNHANKSEEANEKFGEDEDFSGISILAAAACSSSLGKDCGYAEDVSVVEECSTQEQAREVCTKAEQPSSQRGSLKEDQVNSSEMSTGGTSSCVSTEPVGELRSFSSTAIGKGIKDASFGAGSLSLSWDVSCSKDEDTVGNHRPTSRDDRLHWDLNVVMDAWEHPFEDSDMHSNVPHQDGEKPNHDGNTILEACGNLATTCAEQRSVVLGDPRTFTFQPSEHNKGTHDDFAFPNVDCLISLNENSLPSNCNNDVDAVQCVADKKCMHSHETLTDTASDHASQPSTSCTMKKNDDASEKNLKLSGVRHDIDRPMLEGLNSHTHASLCGTSDATCGPVSADVQTNLAVAGSDMKKEVTPKLAGVGTLVPSQGLHKNESAVTENDDLKTRPVRDADAVISNESRLPDSSTDVEEPNTVSTKCELLVALDTTKVQDVSDIQSENIVCNNETTMNLADIPQTISKETCDPAFHDTGKDNMDNNLISSNKFGTVEPRGHHNDTDVYSHPVSVVRMESASELQVDYDSQYEDGELRETNEHAWDEYYVDREVEHVDYGSDNIETCTSNPTDYHVSDSGQVEDIKSAGLGVASVVSSNVSTVEDEVFGKAAKQVVDDATLDQDNKTQLSHTAEEKMKAPRSKELLLESSRSSSDVAAGVRIDTGSKETMSIHGDGLVGSRGTETETRSESRTFRRGLRSQIEGPVGRDVSSREERLNKLESRYEESSSMRSFERIRYPFHNQGRGRQGDNWEGSLDGRRGFKRHYSPIFRGHSKLDGDAVVERDEVGCVDASNDLSYSHQVPPKSRPGTDEEACGGLHSRCRPDRKFSPDRTTTFGRGRSFRYGPSVDGRAGRGGYNGPSPDESFQSSLKYRRPLSRRERSFSPFGGRGHSNAHHSRGKSPSRSRSRSPMMWHSQRGRPGAGSAGTTFLRHRSRSPNFRSEVRLQRLRSPHHQPSFGTDHAIGFRSIPRNHGSPPRNRWTSSRKDEMGHFREFGYKQRTPALERSPGRIRMRDDRAGVTDSPRNLKPDGYYRISDMISDDGAGRGLRYGDNYDERRKNYGPLRPARRSYEDGLGSRLHQDIDDSFPVGNSIRDRDGSNFQGRGLRGIDCRIGNMPRRFNSREQHSFMYERDGKFNSNSKQFGVDMMDSSRSLHSEEQYQSTHTGRFSEVDAPNRGRRYDNYEDRRKQYGAPNLIRRSDTEGIERRLSHHVDENFQDAPDFRGRGTRNFDSRIGSLSTRLGEDQDSVLCGRGET